MNTKESIINLQEKPLVGYNESRCLYSRLSQFEKSEEAAPYSLKLVLSGTEHYQLRGRNYSLKENEFLLVNKGEYLSTIVDSKSIVEGICIYPPAELIEEVYHYFTRSEIDHQAHYRTEKGQFHLTPSIHRIEPKKTISLLLFPLLHRLRQQKPLPDEDWHSFYSALVTGIVQEQLSIDQKLGKLKAKNRITKEEIYRRIQLCVDYLNDNKNGDLDLNELALVGNLSKYHLIRSFKELMGQSPYQYFLHLKRSAAQQLIKKGMPVNDAAQQVGYSDANNLRKALKNLS